MPIIGNEMSTQQIAGSNYSFSGTRLERLGSTEYTLVTIAVDVSASTFSFASDLRQALITAVKSCKRSPRAENLLLRVILFSTSVGMVSEVHGFKPLSDIDPDSYQQFQPGGSTPLYDATFSANGATLQYGAELNASHFMVNAIVFVITDGDDNMSTRTPLDINTQVRDALQQEKLESMVTVLIGINARQYQAYLDNFRKEAGLTQYIDAGDATEGSLAKLADFVSQSVSSTSQALGTGGPSTAISASI